MSNEVNGLHVLTPGEHKRGKVLLTNAVVFGFGVWAGIGFMAGGLNGALTVLGAALLVAAAAHIVGSLIRSFMGYDHT